MAVVVTENHAHKDFIEAAVADGWVATEGPWGYTEGHERTVSLTKHFPEIGGSILLWMIHRNMGVMEWNKEQSCWAHSYPESGWMFGVEAWRKLDTGGDQNLCPKLVDVLAHGLSEDFWASLSLTCDECGKVAEHVNHVAFANKACDDCAQGMRRTMEHSGWTN